MKQLKIMLFLQVCFAIRFTTAEAQTGLPVKISVFNEATAIPFSQFWTTPVHPGLQLGTEFEWKSGRNYRLYPMLSLGYMFHKNLFQGLYLNLELGYEFRFDFGLNLKSSLGLGYLHTFTTTQEYQFRDGTYRQEKDRGNPRLMPNFSLGAGYRLQPSNPASPELFVLYQSWLEYPYSPGFIPLMSHTSLQIGTKFYPLKDKSNKK